MIESEVKKSLFNALQIVFALLKILNKANTFAGLV